MAKLALNLCYTCNGEEHDSSVSGLPSMLQTLSVVKMIAMLAYACSNFFLLAYF